MTVRHFRDLQIAGKRASCVTAALAACLLGGIMPAQSGEVPITDKGVVTFRDACLATAPSFAKAMAVARKFGVKPQMDLGSGMVGMSPDNSYSLQVRSGKECAVTMENSGDPDLHEQFLTAVAQAAGVSGELLAGAAPIKISIHGRTYIVQHDRRGGEAFVIINTSGL